MSTTEAGAWTMKGFYVGLTLSAVMWAILALATVFLMQSSVLSQLPSMEISQFVTSGATYEVVAKDPLFTVSFE